MMMLLLLLSLLSLFVMSFSNTMKNDEISLIPLVAVFSLAHHLMTIDIGSMSLLMLLSHTHCLVFWCLSVVSELAHYRFQFFQYILSGKSLQA